MYGLTINILLGLLVVILAWLLWLRNRQLAKIKPIEDLDRVLKNLQQNLHINRSEGKIQKVAGQLSDILINNLKSEKILFFRRQRRSLELSYVYGLKNIRRPRYRIRLSPELAEKLVGKELIQNPRDFYGLLGNDLSNLLRLEMFNVVFPIFWMNNLFGVYFIRTPLSVDHPLIMTFLLYLNQNLSAAYQIKRLESSRQLLEKQLQRISREPSSDTVGLARLTGTEENPGHLVEMFNYRKVDDLLAGLFHKVKAGLKAERLAFYSPPDREGNEALRFTIGIKQEEFSLDDARFSRIFSGLKKNQVYGLEKVLTESDSSDIREQLDRLRLNNISRFSITDGESGILLWSGRERISGAENNLLNRLERIGRRALANAYEFERLEAKTYTDALTGLYNHRYFVKRLNEEIQRASRYKRGLALLLFDIDDFKVYNDRFGHQWGDELLRRMGYTLDKSLRTIDIVSRYGGDEFCIIMPEADRSTCSVFMERLRMAIAETDFRDRANGFEGRITISIGAAVFPEDADNADRLIYCADMALLRSKARGRNCSTSFSAELLEK